MKLFNWINPLWIIETFLTTRLEPASATTAAMAAPSILGGGMTGAGMMTAGAPIVPGILSASTPTLMGSLGALGTAGLEYAKANPLQTAGLGLNIYDRLSQQTPQVQASQLGVIRPQQAGQYQPVLNAQLQTRNPYTLLG